MRIKNFNLQAVHHASIDEPIKKSALVKTNGFSMGIITALGNNPQKQTSRDYSVISTHYKSYDIAFMLIADGKDDIENSDIATSLLVERLTFWFKRLSKTEINTPIILDGRLLGELRQLNQDLYQYYNPSEISFAMALKGKKQTFIANIGNCRCYKIKNEEATLQTIDSLKWYAYNDPNLITPDEVKFLYGKDSLEKMIGGNDNSKRLFEPFTSIIDNDYDSLVLTTHGVTDVLDSHEIGEIIGQNDTPEALDQIILESISSEPKQIPEELIERLKNSKNHSTLIKETIPGDSSATAIVYKKTKRNS